MRRAIPDDRSTNRGSIMSSQSARTVRPGALRSVVSAVVSGVVVFLIAQAVWMVLLRQMLAHPTPVPWEVPAMTAFLACGIAYLKWGAWPARGGAFRREGVRFNAVPVRTVLLALVAGWASMFAGFCAYAAHRSISGLGGEASLNLPHDGGMGLIAGLVMAGIVAGTVEEVAFRGFMQGALEKRFGLAPAIFVSGIAWALFHTNHSYFGEEILVWFAIFLAVATILGTIAHRTNSVVPGIIVHSGFDGAYFVAAGLLAPRITPIAFLQTLASPGTLLLISGASAVCAIATWVLFFQATGRASLERTKA
jgi:membrane protease YdiL (CAAX protease family)